MDARFDCIICFQRQVMRAVSYINADENVKESILREVMKRLLELDWSLKPIEIANEVHKIVRTITKVKDPYEKIKKDSNNLVLKLYPKLVSIVEQSADCLKAAIKLAIAGNIMDFGAFNDFNLHETINEVLRKQFLFDDYEIFKVKLKDAKSLLFFSDNSGEIGFDKLLIKNMLKEKFFKKIAFVVKGGPFMNDATLEDALYLGLNEFPNIEFLTISNGEKLTGPKISSQAVSKWVKTYDLVISKGQANYEGLSEQTGIFFMLLVKCPTVTKDIGAKINDAVFKYNS